MRWPFNLEDWTKLLGIGLTAAALAFTAFQFFQTYSMNAKRPFLEKQMDLCLEASTVAATVASAAEDDPARADALARFWVLYWGPMSMVEDTTVEHHMVCMGRALTASAPGGCVELSLTQRSLRLGKACRDLIAENWGIPREALVGEGQN